MSTTVAPTRPVGHRSFWYAIFVGRLSQEKGIDTLTRASAGRITVRFGIARSAARCSIGWWVGPSSPRPIESWVQM